MLQSETEIAAISNLPIAEKGQTERKFSTSFWEKVFTELSTYPVVIFAGNLFIQCPEDTEEIVQRRLDLLLHLLKQVHTIPIAILGERDIAHGHGDMIKKQLRSARVSVLTGSDKHHVVAVRFKGTARTPSQTIRFVGLSGQRAGLHVRVPFAETLEGSKSPDTAVAAAYLETHLANLASAERITPVIPILPVAIDSTLSKVLDQHPNLIQSVIVGSGDRLYTPTQTPGGIPLHAVSVPSADNFSYRGEVLPSDLITRIPLRPRN